MSERTLDMQRKLIQEQIEDAIYRALELGLPASWIRTEVEEALETGAIDPS
jgi:FKBP-type peptidyl-prolyl cis-trans isomerase (trigger factor)